MTKEELRDEVWDSLPWLRKRMLGRECVDRMVNMAAAQAPVKLLSHVRGKPDQIAVVEAAWRGNVKKSYCVKYGEDSITFGPLFWIVASAVLQYVITKLLEWWFERRECRALISSWKAEEDE